MPSFNGKVYIKRVWEIDREIFRYRDIENCCILRGVYSVNNVNSVISI